MLWPVPAHSEGTLIIPAKFSEILEISNNDSPLRWGGISHAVCGP